MIMIQMGYKGKERVRARKENFELKVFITGAAGFIGSNVVDRFLTLGNEVTGYDNFSTGHEEFLRDAHKNSAFRLVRNDVLDLEGLKTAMQGSDLVLHLAANADVRF